VQLYIAAAGFSGGLDGLDIRVDKGAHDSTSLCESGADFPYAFELSADVEAALCGDLLTILWDQAEELGSALERERDHLWCEGEL
jgi:hypothetical protein